MDPGLLISGPPEGHFVLEISPLSRVRQLPRTKRLEVELVIYENTRPLLSQLNRQEPKFATDAYATTIGSGTWFVSIYLNRDDIDLTLERESEDRLILTLAPGDPEFEEPRGIYALEELLYDDIPRSPARPTRTVIHPLAGDALTIRLDPADYPYSTHHWKPLLGDLDRGLLLAPSKEPHLETVDRYRHVLTTTSSPETRTVALYQLGRIHEELGLLREARYYYDRVTHQNTPYPANKLHMARARVALAVNRWEDALQRCRDAYEAGAGKVATLECLGIYALSTSKLPPTHIGRALAVATDKPIARLLAAQLLMLDNQHDEALELLRPLPALLRGQHHRIANANLGDALYYNGDFEGARAAWRDAGPRGKLGELVTQRQRALRVLQAKPNQWAFLLPDLEKTANGYGKAAAEAHYILALIATLMDNAEDAAMHLHALLERHWQLANRSDVVLRLESLCSQRLGQLHRDKRWVDEVSFYKICWRPELNRVLANTEMMQDAVEAYTQLGLWNEAKSLQWDINAIHTRDSTDDMEALTSLAFLLVKTDQPREAIETLDYARSLPEAAPHRSKLALLMGHARAAYDQPELAIASYLAAAKDPALKELADLHRAILQSEYNQCVDALVSLEDYAVAPFPIDSRELSDVEVRLALARCLLDQKRYDQAIQQAKLISAATTEPLYQEQAGYISTLAATRKNAQTDLPLDYVPQPFWKQLSQLKAETQAALEQAQDQQQQQQQQQ